MQKQKESPLLSVFDVVDVVLKNNFKEEERRTNKEYKE